MIIYNIFFYHFIQFEHFGFSYIFQWTCPWPLNKSNKKNTCFIAQLPGYNIDKKLYNFDGKLEVLWQPKQVFWAKTWSFLNPSWVLFFVP